MRNDEVKSSCDKTRRSRLEKMIGIKQATNC